ncbi:MAG: ABC transporter substrate-binding protein [Methanospirillaceae archaeon]|nr:ABC transporter substrate-binding protein [Methanospirillaceae archaeon]
MKQIILVSLILLILVAPGVASLPGDINNDNQISSAEITVKILDHLEESNSIPQDLSDAAWIYQYWNGTTLIITDTLNRTIIMDRPVRRLASFDGSTLETLRSLNVTDVIVAVSINTYDDTVFFPEYQKTQNVGTIWSPDIEALMKTNPDTVIIYATISQDSVQAIEDQIESFDPTVRIFRFDLFKPEVYQEEVEKVGKIFGKEPEAAEFLAFYSSVMGTIQERIEMIPEESRIPVYFESWYPYKSAAPGSGYHEKVTFAGGKNIFADAPNPYPAIDPEAILKLQPEVIIKQVGAGDSKVGGYNDPDSSDLVPEYESLFSRVGWDTLPAVQNNSVHIINSDVFGSASHFIGLQYLAKWFYPELFTDIDPLATHQEYLDRFQHLDFDPARQGGFVYP